MAAYYEFKVAMDEYDDGAKTWLVSVPSFPEITTYGDDKAAAAVNAKGAIEEAIMARMHYGETIPVPKRGTPGKGYFVEVEALVILKILLYEICQKGEITRAELARRMNKHRPQVDRLFDLNHNSRIDQFEDAAEALGFHLNVGFGGTANVA